ncbi:MAG: hypothetical protein GXY03_14120 [Solirubrobacterales bacterium]|nr:hypothetical protein [Solirubrobacterales bacterium]
MLVIDASAATAACAKADGFKDLGEDLVAPPLMWSEVRSNLILDCRLVTVDGRLRRGADRLGLVVTPDEL